MKYLKHIKYTYKIACGQDNYYVYLLYRHEQSYYSTKIQWTSKSNNKLYLYFIQLR